MAVVERLLRNAQKNGGHAPFPQFDKSVAKELRKTFKVMARDFRAHTSGRPLTGAETEKAFRGQNQFIESQLGMLGFHTCVADPRRYERVADEWCKLLCIKRDGMDETLCPPIDMMRKYARIRTFAKVESISKTKFPRNISPRDPMFNYIWAQFTKPLEQYLYKYLSAKGEFRRWCDTKEYGVSNPWIGKSMNKMQRGMAVKYKIDLFRKMYGVHPIIFSTDCSGFDAHLTMELQDLEHEFYKMCFPAFAQYLHQLLGLMRENKFSCDGVRGSVRGARMSGDMHTGLGNTILIIAMLITAFRMHKISRYDILADGDDTLVFVHPEDTNIVETAMPNEFLRFGHELRVENRAESIFDVVWCQSKVVRCTKDGQEVYAFVQDPRKTFATMGSHIHCRDINSAQGYFEDVLLAYERLYSFIPLFQNLAQDRESDKSTSRRLQASIAFELIRHESHLEESVNTLADYCRAWDLPPSVYSGGEWSQGDLRQALDLFFGQ